MTRFSTSFEEEAYTKVRPDMLVSFVIRLSEIGIGKFEGAACCVWRITNAKVNISSSSPLSLSRKFGGPLILDSGS